jgi:tRNA(Ile)-lysidine synthase
MAPLGPFEPRPRIAVAVSGGADSVALAFLMQRWATARRGSMVALIVDHGLRPEAAAEARQAGGWLRDAGIEHRILRWRHGAVRSALQASARTARYRLLTDWCRDHSVLHLALAHHRDDQAETVLLRVARGSGPDGLAAMAKVSETADVRLLRPLLDWPKGRLRGFLAARGQAWIEDPSNADSRFARVRVRAALAATEDTGAAAALAGSARQVGRTRARREAATAALLARAASPDPFGMCTLDLGMLRAAPPEIAQRALARALMCVGGQPYPPRREKLERLAADLFGAEVARSHTLAGCLVLRRGAKLVIVRETRNLAAGVATGRDREVLWDGRFRVSLGRPAKPASVAAVGAAAARSLRKQGDAGARGLPVEAIAALPGVWDAKGLRAVPQLGYEQRRGAGCKIQVVFRPAQPLAGAAFPVV